MTQPHHDIRPTQRSRQRFLYEQVASELRQQIRMGVYPPGTMIASQEDLAQKFGVSAITIRRALRNLVLEGLLVSRQGLGAFVKESRRIVRTLGSAPTISFEEEMRRVGIEPGIKELAFSIVSAPEEIAKRLQLAPATDLYRHEKMILADGEPVSHDTIFAPRKLGTRLRKGLARQFAFSLLAEHGLEIDHVDFRIDGGGASEEQAGLFDLSIGFPLIILHYTPFKPDGTPILTGVIVSRSDRLTFDLCTRPELHLLRPATVPAKTKQQEIKREAL